MGGRGGGLLRLPVGVEEEVLTPASFGKYKVVEKIGEGGFGTVYEGRDPVLKRTVAIKTLTSSQPDLRQRFLREAEIAAGLQHPGITTVFDFGTEEDRPYLVQEYLTGEDLDAVIARREPLPAAERLDLLIQVARALHHAHERDVVHRDVKPANIRRIRGGQIKIMDFGIAKLLSAEDNLTRTGTSMGTLGYLSPEQLRGDPVDRRADVFSFGVLAYELLAYRRPFQGDSASSVLYQVAHEDPPPLKSVWPRCPDRLARMVDRCLAKNPADRPSDLKPVIAELRTARGALPAEDSKAAVDPTLLAPTVVKPATGSVEEGPPDPTAFRPKGRTYDTAIRLSRNPAARTALAVGLAALLVIVGWLAWWSSPPVSDSASETSGSTQSDDSRDVEETEIPTQAEGGESGGEEGAGMKMEHGETNPESSKDQTASEPLNEALSENGLNPRPRTTPVTVATAEPPAATLPPSPPRILVIILGEPAQAANTAETALLRALAAGGFETLIGNPTDGIASQDPRSISAAGRNRSAATVVVGNFQGEAQPSAGRFYTGRARLNLQIYDVRRRALAGSATADVGGRGPGMLAPSELSALNEAAEEAGRLAAAEVMASLGTGSGEGP